MKIKSFLAFLTLTMLTGFAAAQVGVNAKADLDVNVQVDGGTSSSNANARGEANATARGNATSSTNKGNKVTATTSKASSTKAHTMSRGQEHMSVVARFVQSLLAVADREGGIGAQVRAIAKSQNDTASSSAAALANIESRSKIITFLFGADYKSVGDLRSDMVVTQSNIDNLQKLVNQAVNPSDKAELEAQLKTLQESQLKLEAFLKAHESSFSLFGWLNR